MAWMIDNVQSRSCGPLPGGSWDLVTGWNLARDPPPHSLLAGLILGSPVISGVPSLAIGTYQVSGASKQGLKESGVFRGKGLCTYGTMTMQDGPKVLYIHM